MNYLHDELYNLIPPHFRLPHPPFLIPAQLIIYSDPLYSTPEPPTICSAPATNAAP